MAKVYEDGPYGVKILNQPGQTCTVSGGDNGTGTGTVGGDRRPAVTCVTKPIIIWRNT